MRRAFTSIKEAVIKGSKVTIITCLTLKYVGGFVICYGPSMEPTLKTKDIVLTEQISPRLGRIDVGDIVVAKSPLDNRSVCKRVVAGPGDIVLFKNKTLTVPEDCVWLEGDNKDNSNDSRFYGPVPYSKVRRRCFCRLWPDFDFFGLDTPSRFYLDSNPTPRQRVRHINSLKREYKQKQQQQFESQTVLLKNHDDTSTSGELETLFPKMQPSKPFAFTSFTKL